MVHQSKSGRRKKCWKSKKHMDLVCQKMESNGSFVQHRGRRHPTRWSRLKTVRVFFFFFFFFFFCFLFWLRINTSMLTSPDGEKHISFFINSLTTDPFFSYHVANIPPTTIIVPCYSEKLEFDWVPARGYSPRGFFI